MLQLLTWIKFDLGKAQIKKKRNVIHKCLFLIVSFSLFLPLNIWFAVFTECRTGKALQSVDGPSISWLLCPKP